MQKKNQQGSVLMLLVPIVAVLLLVVLGSVFWVMTHQQKPVQHAAGAVSADDSLTNGNSNADLNQDVRILSAGLTRDGSYVSSTNKALNDQPQTVLND